MVRLLHVTRQAACAQCERAVGRFLTSIDNTLQKHVPIQAQGPLVANTLTTVFQFQMSIWHMVGEECVRPICTKHSDWCGLAGIVQAIVETFPKNCALMFPPAPMQPMSFLSSFKPVPSNADEDDDDDTLGTGGNLPKFSTSTPTHSGSWGGSAGLFGTGSQGGSAGLFGAGSQGWSAGLFGTGSQGGSAGLFDEAPSFTSGALPHGGTFSLALDNVAVPGTSAHARGSHAGDLDLGEEADDEGDPEKGTSKDGSVDPTLDADEMAILESIILQAAPQSCPPVMPKSGDKWAATHFEGGSASSELSAEDHGDTRPSSRSSRKGGMPTRHLPLISGAQLTSTQYGSYSIRRISSVSKFTMRSIFPPMIRRLSTPLTTAPT